MHQLLLIAMGTPIFDNCDLEGLAEAAGSRKRWAFLLTASPLAVPHGTGSPLNPIAASLEFARSTRLWQPDRIQEQR